MACARKDGAGVEGEQSALEGRAGEPDSRHMARIFAALSNPTRIDILRHIARHGQCGCKDITEVLPLAQSTVSQHLKVLIDAGIVVVEIVPPRSRYSVNGKLLKDMAVSTSGFMDSCCGKLHC